MAHYIASSRGNKMLVDGNCEYRIHYKNVDGTTSYWRSAKKWCKARFHTETESEEIKNSKTTKILITAQPPCL